MNNPKILKLVIALLVVALLTSLFFWHRARRENSRWQWQVMELGAYKGSARAIHDFQAGQLRLFALGGGSDSDRYSGTNDGAFEVWIPQYYPPLGSPHRFAMERWIAIYNHQMQSMHRDPKKYLTTTNTNSP
jgi:hypothetical protein